MSSSASKYKSKKYFAKKGQKRSFIEVNQRGFLCSCNNREKDCVKESYNILNEYADKLYPPEPPKSPAHDPDDISDCLTAEISQLKQESTTRRFQVVDSGAKNFLFIRTTLPNPLEVAEAIIRDIHETKVQKTKFLIRLIPVEIITKATLDDIGGALEREFCPKYFTGAGVSFAVVFNHRNNNVLERDAVIKAVAQRVLNSRPDHRVDLKAPEVCVVVEVIKAFAFLSVIPGYFKYKKYNLLNVSNEEEK